MQGLERLKEKEEFYNDSFFSFFKEPDGDGIRHDTIRNQEDNVKPPL